MLEQLRKTIEQECGYRSDGPLLVGVSGGPDSLALLHGLNVLGIPVIAAHLDHGLRDESRDDHRFVEEFSRRYNIRFVSSRVDTEEFAKKYKLSVEEAGRELRYSFLFGQAEKFKAAGVVVGHNADDQVETVLMHLIRGAGLDGLSGMRYAQLTSFHGEILLLRPLLGTWRKDIEAYCETNGLLPRFDRSNFDTTYFRNSIRHELILEMESYNPKIKQALWKTANTLNEDQEFIENQLERIFQKYATIDEENSEVLFSRDDFIAQLKGVQRRLVRLGIKSLRPDIRDIGFQEVEKVIGYVLNPPRSGSADLFQGLTIVVDGDRFFVVDGRERSSPAEGFQLGYGETLSLLIPGEVVSDKKWVFAAERRPVTDELLQLAVHNPDPMIAYLDASKLSSKLEISPRKLGDRFSPLGLGGKRTKVSDFMINVKISKSQRKFWPLLRSQSEIIWILGYQIAESVRVTDQTKEIVILSVHKRNQSENSSESE